MEHVDLDLYGPDMGRLTYAAMFNAARQTLEAGFTAILDATFLRPEDRQSARRLGERLNVPVNIYWLEAEEQVLRDRIMQRAATGSDVSDADLKVLERQLSRYERPQENDICFLTDSNKWPIRKADS
jgi:predicted kinase